jgi:hypothetical protein
MTGDPAQGTWFSRTLEYQARRRGMECGARDFATTETVILSPLPCWAHLPEEAYRQRVADLVNDIVRDAACQRANTGRGPSGVAFVLEQNPHDLPPRTKRGPAPYVHAATATARKALREAFRLFLNAYRSASARLRAGDLQAVFPEPCFRPALAFARGSPFPPPRRRQLNR